MHRSQLTTLTKIFWVAYLAIALVFIQGARLHMHTYDHESTTSEHAHQEHGHVDYGVSAKKHPDQVGQIDLSQQGVLKKLPPGSMVIALFSAVILLLPRRLCSRISWRLYRHAPFLSSAFSLRPPLRAPPL